MNFNPMNIKIPNEQQCKLILKEYGAPKHVIAHCQAVCAVSTKLALKLNEVGYDIDIPLLRASALLHDIARVHEHHETVGAEYLRSIGYIEVANIVALHTKYAKFNKLNEIKEIDLLCIGDRTVKEDQYVGVDERMEYIRQKAIRLGKTQLTSGIEEGKAQLKKYISDIEEKIGITLDNLMKGKYE